MLSNILPYRGLKGGWPPPRPIVRDAGALAFALERMTPELWLVSPGEGPAEGEARRLAAVDILDSLLSEYADEIGGAR
jgi:hypothetical protein